jgi:FeS assembly SUF system regulator
MELNVDQFGQHFKSGENMLKIGKITDYSIVVMAQLARTESREPRSARFIAETTRLPQATVSKVLSLLQKKGLVESHRGLCGGYLLRDRPQNISLLSIVEAIEGPVSLTACSVSTTSLCKSQDTCEVGPHWPVINNALINLLEGIRLNQLAAAPSEKPLFPASVERTPTQESF